MRKSVYALQLAQNNNGILTGKMAQEYQIEISVLSYLVKEGKLEKTARGVYQIPGLWDDEYFQLQYRFHTGIYSHLSALFLLHLTDVNPESFSLTFPQGYNTEPLHAIGIESHISSKNNFELGQISVQTPCGNLVKCFSPERTLCDIVNPKFHTDIRIIADAYKAYIRGKNKDLSTLMLYSEKLHVQKKVRAYMEVLL